MGLYFETDGLRGIFGKEITPEITTRVGNSLAGLCKKFNRVLVARDTRATGSLLTTAIAYGLLCAGINVDDVGIAPTPAVAFLTKKLGYDYGIMISASHNPKNHNGIKIFNHNGDKISHEDEFFIEKHMLNFHTNGYAHLGEYNQNFRLTGLYFKQLCANFNNLDGLNIALDCANGAAYAIAKKAFKAGGAKVITFNCGKNGKKINQNCGALYPHLISSLTKQHHCHMGFSFDGDADRVIACDGDGKLLDGDDILYILSSHFTLDKVVGTVMSNKGFENALNRNGTTLYRADVGDKNVSEMMKEKQAILGGETCGHIINSLFSSTGDGILTALTLAQIAKVENKPLSQLSNYNKMPQIIKSILVENKHAILQSQTLQNAIYDIKQLIGNNGRLLVRASGTESKIRVMCEHNSLESATYFTENLSNLIEKLNKNINF